MDLTGTIESAENQFKQILEEFFISVYNEEALSSHGIDHHRRVWRYSKELFQLIPANNTPQFYHLPSKLIISSYLHDIGMSVDSGLKHGIHSRDLCIRFLAENRLDETDYSDVLEAIENHDNKDYSGSSFTNDLLKILSVADDLDAFGFTGIYRYLEIYLTRGINPDKIGYLIKENAEKRFDNFLRSFGSHNEIVQKQSKRYNILVDFFSRYNEQVPNYQFWTSHPSGFCGVIEVFVNMIKSKIELKKIYANSDKYLTDSLIKWFFGELKKETFCL